MCGIVGYIGSNDAVSVLINGLLALEYRGYDSAGIAVVDDRKLHYVKCSGKVVTLAQSLDGQLPRSGLGIAHTRWATHGIPSARNAHPLLDCAHKVAVVHNGIIENYYSLRGLLEDRGHTFQSDTDTEVVCHLIEEKRKCVATLEEAILGALREIEGTYGLAIVLAEEPELLIAARKGSPLLVGIGDGQYTVASDRAALAGQASKVMQLADGEVAFITRVGVNIRTLENSAVSRECEALDLQRNDVRVNGYTHFMQKEIFEQPVALTNVMRGRISTWDDSIMLGGLHDVMPKILAARRIILTGCGTSWHSALYGKYLFEKYTRMPVEVEYASEFRYRDPVVDEQDIVIAISQSGETADTLAALRLANEKGAKSLGICNAVGSSVARESDAGIYIHAGPEIGVASTKAFTSQLVALSLLALSIAWRRDRTNESVRALSQELRRLPELAASVLQLDQCIQEVAGAFYNSSNVLYLGRGYSFPVALEGALKLKEISYIHAEGYPAAEMKHGPIALIDGAMPVVFLAPRDRTYSKVLSNMEEVKARGGRIIAIIDDEDPHLNQMAEYTIRIPRTSEALSPVLSVIPLQLLAYHIALLRGCDVDKPRNLAKSVTVE